MEVLQAFWAEHSGLIITIGTSVMGLVAIIGTAIAMWNTKVKPVLETITTWFKKKDEIDSTDITNQLQSVTLETQITDLKAKIENPTISDTLKQAYITQLATLEVLKAKLDAGMATVTETTDKFL